MQTGLHRNTISKVYRQLETDGVVEAMAGSGIYVRDQQKPREIKNPPHIRNRGVTDLDQEVRKCVDGLLNAGCTLQQSRELLTREIDWRLRCGARVLVSTPREDVGASMLIAEELQPCLDVPVEVVPMEELENVLENSSQGTVVTSRYFLQPVEELAKKHSVRAVAVDLNDFRLELSMFKELRPGSCVGLVSISPGILRAAEDPSLNARQRVAIDDGNPRCGQPASGTAASSKPCGLRSAELASCRTNAATKPISTDENATNSLC